MLALFLLSLVAPAFAAENVDARCPVVRAVDNFNFAAFANGIWYEVGRYDNKKETNSNCGYAKYTPFGDRFKIENVFVKQSRKYIIEGSGRLAPDAGNTGKLIFTLPYGKNGQNTDSILNVMSTDNANYAVLYYCNYDEKTKTRQELSWIFSRTKTLSSVFGYFTISGRCPDNVKLQENFKLADFYGKWYQAYHYSSDDQHNNNCSTIELLTRPSGIYLNQSRIDLGLFHRFSVGKVDIPSRVEDAASMELVFAFKNAPRRLKIRRYPFHILATNYNYYATVYTCEYSPLINKHFIYVWILSRHPTLNDVSTQLASKPLQLIGLDSSKLSKDDRSKCTPKYYEDVPIEPTTFRFPVPI